MSPADELSRSIDAFKQWRATRKKSTRKTPEGLQQQAVELLAHYSRSRVSSELGLSGTQVKRWQGSDGDVLAFVLMEVECILNNTAKSDAFCSKRCSLQTRTLRQVFCNV